MIAYVDSSVVIRLVLGAQDSLREWTAVRLGVTSALLEVECLRVLDRLRLRGSSAVAERRHTFYDLVRDFHVVDISRLILARAALPMPTPVGTLDALHLATAMAWRDESGEAVSFLTHDRELALAARACGFTVLGA